MILARIAARSFLQCRTPTSTTPTRTRFARSVWRFKQRGRRLEIEARKAELQAKAGWNVPKRNYLTEVNGLLLEQCDEDDDYRDPRQVEEWLPVPKKSAPDEPQEMSREDRCNVDVGSLIALNIVPHRLADRYVLGDVDPEAVDLDELADYQESRFTPIAFQLKTEQTHRDVVAFRSKRR